jgi:ethanolamine ammonia-lyase small subunit
MSELRTRADWLALRRLTPARIALGRVGHSMPTAPMLEFALDHARARDAVHHALDVQALQQNIERLGMEVLQVRSAAADRREYLVRPDLGRRLHDESSAMLGAREADRYDLVFVAADGLSALAVARHAVPLLQAMQPWPANWHIGPLVIAQQARVAVGDDIGALLRAQLVVVLIGERPGLSSADSLGAYVTYAPRVGRSDAERNCISNIRPEGLGYAAAAKKLHYLLDQARRRALTGVALKDDSDLPLLL